MAAKKDKAAPTKKATAKSKAAKGKSTTTTKANTASAESATKKAVSKASAATKKTSPSSTKAATKKKTAAKKTTAAKAKTKSAAEKKTTAKTAAKKKAPAKKTTATAKTKTAKAKSTAATKGKAAPKSKSAAKGKSAAKAKAAPLEKRPPVRKRPVVKKAPVTLLPRPTMHAKASADSPFKNYTPYEAKKNEVYMNQDQEDHFRTMLNNWRTELMEEVDRTVNHMQDEAANFPDPADRATQEEEFSIELRTRDRERKLIKKIDQTLERLEQQDYGFCDTCGVEIGLRRLEARPTATQCVDCKTLDELRERQLHG